MQRVLHFKPAFLNGILKEEIFVEQPKGFEVGDSWAQVLLLFKAICGLKQVSVEWRRALVVELAKLALHPIITDPGTFVRQSDGIILSTQVDDVNAVGSPEALDTIERELEKVFGSVLSLIANLGQYSGARRYTLTSFSNVFNCWMSIHHQLQWLKVFV